jgi:hypothetical protein
MYSKDELSSKNLSELEDIAKTAGIDVDNSKRGNNLRHIRQTS